MKLSTWKKKHSGDRFSHEALRDALKIEDADRLRDAARAQFDAKRNLEDEVASVFLRNGK